MLKNRLACLMWVGKGAEGEIVAQSRGTQLRPAYSLEVPGGDAEDLASVVQGSDQLTNRRTHLRPKVFTVRFHLGAHARNDARQLGLQRSFRYTGAGGNGTQDPDIRIAMHVDAIGVRLH